MVLVIAAACALAAAWIAGPALSAKRHLQPGDRLIYDLTYELQEHQFPPSGANQPEVVHDSAGSGTQTFSVHGVGADETADVGDTIDFSVKVDGRPASVHSSVNSVIASDGQLFTSQLGAGEVAKALDLADAIIEELSSHPPRIGETWRTPVRITGLPVLVQLTKTVSSSARVRNFPSFIIKSAGSSLLRANPKAPSVGSVSISATTYYDARDRLLVGQAFRSFVVVNAGQGRGHANVTTVVNIALRSLGHGGAALAQPRAPKAPEHNPPASPSPSPTPAPARNPSSPQPYPTSTAAEPYPTVSP